VHYLNKDDVRVPRTRGAPTWEQMGFARLGEFCLGHRSLALSLDVANNHRDRPIDFDRFTNELVICDALEVLSVLCEAG
jgi:hypothetical protein